MSNYKLEYQMSSKDNKECKDVALTDFQTLTVNKVRRRCKSDKVLREALSKLLVELNKNDEKDEEEQIVDPWEVKGTSAGIQYQKLLENWGISQITPDLLTTIEGVTGKPVHHLVRRGFIFAHRDLTAVLERYVQKKPFYVYTGRGSSGNMHIGHLVPFVLTKWLQDAFGCLVVIQMSDDEKFYFKGNLSLEEAHDWTMDNVKDIIAMGFDLSKTFIFSNTDYLGTEGAYPLVAKMDKLISVHQEEQIYGFDERANVGMVGWPSKQIAPAFPAFFPKIFGKQKDVLSLVPYAIDQDPYFRVSRDIAVKLGYPKPAVIAGKFLPSLGGINNKMSTTEKVPVIELAIDTPKDIANKIKTAFSGGRDTLKEHREKGADLSVDIPYIYLQFFEEDDAKVAHIAKEYSAGRMTTGEVKKILTAKLTEMIGKHQETRKTVTDDVIKQFFDINRFVKA